MILDFDEVLVHADGTTEDYGILKDLAKMDVELCVASRNDRYHVENRLRDLSIFDLFRHIMSDFRPKSYQLKHVLWLYEKDGCQFNRVYFVDDYEPNLTRVRADLPKVHCLHFGSDVLTLSDVQSLVSRAS